MFEFLSGVLRLGEDMRLPHEERGYFPRRRECSPRGGNVRLGEIEDRKWEFLVRLSEAFACLSEPRRLGEGRLRLSEPVIM